MKLSPLIPPGFAVALSLLVDLALFATLTDDEWDALSNDRPYRPAWTEESIIQYLKNQSGKQLAPHVVGTFMRLRAEANVLNQIEP